MICELLFIPNEALYAFIQEQDREVLDQVQRLLVDQKLYRDDNLTLSRLARRAAMKR